MLASFLLFRPGASGQAVWVSTGPGGAVVQCLAADPSTPGTVYAGVDQGGVFKSTDGGNAWRAFNVALTQLDVISLAVSAGDPNTIFAGTLNGAFASYDAGASWAPAPGGLPVAAIDSIVFDASAPSRAYAVSSSGWLGRSSDGGASWQSIATEAVNQGPRVIAIDPTHGSTVYLGTANNGVYRSDDSGATWTARNTGLTNLHVSALAVDPTAPSTVYAGTVNGGAFRSLDRGGSWSASSNGLSGSNITALAADASGVVYLANTAGLFAVAAGDLSWQVRAPATFGNAIAIGPGSPGRLYYGSGKPAIQAGGVLFSDDGSTFSPWSSGLNGMTVAAMAVDPSDPMRVLECGPFRGSTSVNGGVDWAPGSIPSFGLSLGFDPQSPGVVYEGVATGVFKSTDGGGNWGAASSGLPASLVRALLVLSGPSGHILAGTAAGVYRSTAAGANWTRAASSGPAVVYSLGRDPSSTALWAGADDGVYRSTDDGVNWQRSGSGVSGPVRSVLASAASPRVFAGTDAGLFVSSDGGAIWSPAGGGIPAAPVYALVEDSSSHVVYAGTFAGVYESTDAGVTWSVAAEGLSNPQVLSLARLPNGTLLAGTQGGSVFLRVFPAERGPVVPAERHGQPRALPERP